MRWPMLTLVVLATACGGSGEADLSREGAFIRRGEYLITNNQWGKALALGRSSQSIFLEELDGRSVFGWDWSWVGTGVVAYPNVFFGDSPFDATRTTSLLPMRVGARRITARFETRTEATGTYDAAFDLFLTSTPDAAKGTRTHEIMIWTDAQLVRPAGQVVGELEVGGTTWDLYYEPDIDLDEYGWPEPFVYAAYLAREPVAAGPLDLSDFIDDLLARGYIPGDAYLACISYGNEIVMGAGHTEVAGYAIEIE